MIPLFEVNGHELVSLNGKKSSFYQIIPSDIEGMTDFSQKEIFSELERNLVDYEDIAKIYWLNNKLYINAFSDIELANAEIVPCNEPLTTFINNYSDQVSFYENYLTVGDEFIRLLSIKDYPVSLNLLETQVWPDFVLNLKKIEKTHAKTKINFKRKLHYSNLFKGMRDVDSENAYNEAEDLLDNIARGDSALFEVETFLIIRSNSKENLDKKTEEIYQSFKSIDGCLFQEERGLPYFFQSLIPGVPASFKRADLCPSGYLSYLLPFHRDFIHLDGLKLSSRQGNDLYINLFSKSAINYNVLITGTSGQGKSMMANKILEHELSNGVKGMILDLGNSFYKTSKFYKGEVLSDKFNPMQFRNPRYLKEFILSVIEEKVGKKEEGKLFESIKSILEGEITKFSDLLLALEKDFEGISYYFSELQTFFTDEECELNHLTYCDFSNYPEAMKAPLIIYLIEFFKHLEGKKIFVFDECWHLLNKNADYIAECFRTFRKHQASAIAISQNLDDFSITQLGRVIIQNTYWKFMFRQSLSVSEFMDQHTIELLNTIQSKKGDYSEFLLLSEDHKKPIRYYPSYLEYQLFTSDREDNNKLFNYINTNKEFLSFQECLINFTKLKHPTWEYTDER